MNNPNLVPCQTCDKSVSREAAVCPHCGQGDPTGWIAAAKERKSEKKALGCGIIILLAIVLTVLLFSSSS